MWGDRLAEFHILEHQVLFRECDATGDAHVSSYFKWFEDARFGIAEDAKIMCLDELKENDILIPVVSSDCRFYAPLKAKTLIQIHTTLALEADVRMKFHHVVVEKETNLQVAEGNTQVVVISKEDKKIQFLGENVKNRIKKYILNYKEVD